MFEMSTYAIFMLVGFFAMLQAWFQVLDMGLTPTMAREAARFNGGAIDAMHLRRLLRVILDCCRKRVGRCAT